MLKKTDVITSSWLLLVRSAPPKGRGHMLGTKMTGQTVRPRGWTVRACAELVSVSSFSQVLLAKFTELTRKIVCNGSRPPPYINEGYNRFIDEQSNQ
jgi:hypothetical protein